MKRVLLAFLFGAIGATSAQAQSNPGVTVSEAWVRATVPTQTTTGAYMKLKAARATRLVEARSAVAEVVEIHEMSLVDNVMKMRAIPGLDLPAGRTVELRPGSYHVMLVNLKGQVKTGDAVPITLVFEDAGKRRSAVEVKAAVRGLTDAGAGQMHKH